MNLVYNMQRMVQLIRRDAQALDCALSADVSEGASAAA